MLKSFEKDSRKPECDFSWFLKKKRLKIRIKGFSQGEEIKWLLVSFFNYETHSNSIAPKYSIFFPINLTARYTAVIKVKCLVAKIFSSTRPTPLKHFL